MRRHDLLQVERLVRVGVGVGVGVGVRVGVGLGLGRHALLQVERLPVDLPISPRISLYLPVSPDACQSISANHGWL